MSEADLNLLKAHFDRLRRECDTREKAIAQLQREGLLDENGKTSALYRDIGENTAWQ